VIDTVIWRRLDVPGHDVCTLSHVEEGYLITGVANFLYGSKPCSLRYAVHCNEDWQTLRASVHGHIGKKEQRVDFLLTADASWLRNGVEQPRVRGLPDIDLSFTPATNTLAVRREKFSIGQPTDTTAAWLRFPGLHLAPLRQTYTKLPNHTYSYTALEGEFKATIVFRRSGLVSRYEGLWAEERVARSEPLS